MNRLFLASTAVYLVMGSGASAADIAPAPRPRPVPALAAGHWSGTYIGGFAGGHWSKDRWTSDESIPFVGPFDLGVDGFTGGFVSGANLQVGHFVWGVETDIGVFTGANNFGSLQTLFPANASIDSIETKLRYNGHARVRFGYDMGSWMPFMAAGAAYARTRTTVADPGNVVRPAAASIDQNRFGYTIGAGVDWMFARNWIARVEYLHDRYLAEAAAVPTSTNSEYLELNSNIVRAALMYKFDDGASHVATGGIIKAPPVARLGGSWAGVYIGAFAGGHWSTDRWSSDETDPPSFFGAFDLKADGFTGGALIGANVQYGRHVWGVEADVGVLTGAGTQGNLAARFPAGDGAAEIDSIETRTRWNAHARIRSGYSFGSWMPFVATGVAYANTRMTIADPTNAGTARPTLASTSVDRIGISTGGGVDWMVAPNWMLRGEYIYDRYATASFNTPAQGNSEHMQLSSHIVRGAVMHKFGDDAAVPAVTNAPVYAAAGWSGGYVGAFAGGHWSRDRWMSDESTPVGVFGAFDLNADGANVGGLIGANLQYGRAVFGVEADLGWMTGAGGLDSLRAAYASSPFLIVVDSAETRMRANAHARMRFGYAAGNWLPFVAGGVAYANTRVTLADPVVNFGEATSQSVTLNRLGFTFGGGVDWKFASNWIGRVEYLYDRYGTASFGSNVTADSEHMELSSNIVRGALIYQFSGAPVAAAY